MNKKAALVIAYLITFAVYNIGGFESSDILMGVVFAVIYILLDIGFLRGLDIKTTVDDAEKEYPGIRKASGITAGIWTLSHIIYMGDEICRGLENPLFSGVYMVLTGVGLFLALYYALRLIYICLLKAAGRHDSTTRAPAPGRVMVIYAGIILLCMLPFFILNFPGTLTVDSFDQLAQVRGLADYSDHHPWVHTMLIKALYQAGYKLTGDIYGGIAVYTGVQMVLLTVSVAYAIAVMSETGCNRTCRILMLLGFVLYPYNEAYSITMWKDVLFAAAVLVLTVTIYRISCMDRGGRVPLRDIILFLISGTAMCTLRHNGLYAYILTMIIILVYEVRIYKVNRESNYHRCIPLFLMMLVTVLAVGILKGPIQRANNVKEGDFAHNLPIPLQQVARVVYDGCELTQSETISLERINTIEFLREEYTPGGADPVMQWVVFGDSGYLESHKSEYISLWIKLGLRYPMEYIRAYTDQTKGYYTTMMPEQTEYYGILPNDYGLEPMPLAGASVRIKLNEICSKIHNMFPVYGILYSMGACLLLLIFGAGIIILQDKKDGIKTGMKQGSRLLAYMPAASITITLMIAAPLAADLRYSYPLLLSMPALICITLKGNEAGNVKIQKESI